MKKIPFARPYLGDTDELISEMTDYIEDVSQGLHKVSNGEYVQELEEKVAKMSGADHAIACSSCTMGLAIALGACTAQGVCYTQSFTWDSTAIAGNLQGSPVRFREIDREKWTVPSYDVGMSKPEDIGYVIAVDTFGTQHQPVSYLPIFYDRAHSLGQRFRTLGVALVVSLSPSKIVTGGEGGVILTNKEKFVPAIRTTRDLISRMSEHNAIFALNALNDIRKLLDWKEETYNMYKKAFPECFFQQGESNHQVIGMLFDTNELRDKVVNDVADVIETKVYYKPLHFRNKASDPMPVTEEIYSRILCLPSWYGVNREFVIEKIREVMEG